ncbi:hypothetical protein TNIN_431161 [Trichonephila inaurata madagascariensis]|uniref:Peptidase A2 domain-containing protein n=1 Tax=Trichonephila inaurata madagascariensis TaxID=2747483 RepID=A0A8X6MBI8_9ARAC|nr:hypothetical protein TNIN_431161 [Trichonephila inaurata madagascariensis]
MICSHNKFQNKGKFYAPVNKSNAHIHCGLFNHTSNECNQNVSIAINLDIKALCVFHKPDVKNEVVSEVVNEINSAIEMHKTVKINDYKFDALINTGSTVTLARYSVYESLRMPTLNLTKIKQTALGNNEIQPIGSFKFPINIENRKFKTYDYVIDNLQTTIDVIIVTDILKQTEFKINANGTELIPKKEDSCIDLINVSKAHNQSEEIMP